MRKQKAEYSQEDHVRTPSSYLCVYARRIEKGRNPSERVSPVCVLSTGWKKQNKQQLVDILCRVRCLPLTLVLRPYLSLFPSAQ